MSADLDRVDSLDHIRILVTDDNAATTTDGPPSTPDGRPGAVVQFHVPRFRKDRVEALERSLLVRISQNVLTCPTTACWRKQSSVPRPNSIRNISSA